MGERNVNVKVGRDDSSLTQWVVGKAFAYQSSIWQVKGLYFAVTPSGGRELWWILAEQEIVAAGVEGGE